MTPDPPPPPIPRQPARATPRFLLAGALVAAVLWPSVAMSQAFRFRAQATRVLVDVLVLDGDGEPVPGLGVADFELYENGVEQDVLSADVVDWQGYVREDATVPARMPTGADSAGPAPASTNATPRRFVIVFNRRRADPVNLRRAKRGLQEFVANHMVEGDETMIIEFAAQPRILQEFWPGKEQTVAAVREIVPGAYESPVGPEMDAKDTFSLLYRLGEALEPVDGRKIVVLFTANLQTFADPRARVGEGAGLEVDQFPTRQQLDETRGLFGAIRQLNHANATLYTVDLEGVYGNENRILTPSLNQFDVMGNEAPLVPSSPMDRMNEAAHIPAESGAASLAVATGGEYYPRATNFAVPLNRVGQQNRLYYMLSFSPADPDLDGSYREVEVRVRDHPDYRVVARSGYFARERTAPPMAEDRVARGEFDYAVPTAIHTYAYLLQAAPGGAFAVFHAALPEESLEAPRQLGLRVLDAGGARLAESGSLVDRQRFWVSAAAPVTSGTHRIEVLVGAAGGAGVQSVATELEVPPRYGEDFSLSSVFPFVAEAHGQRREGPPVRPIASFARGEAARVAFFVFAGDDDPVERVRVAYSIFGAGGAVALEAERPGILELDPEQTAGSPIRLTLETAGLSAGRYRAVVRVTEAGGAERTAASELGFEIR